MMCVRRRGGAAVHHRNRAYTKTPNVFSACACAAKFVHCCWRIVCCFFGCVSKRGQNVYIYIAAINTKMYNNNAIEAVDVCATKIYTGGDGIWWQDGFSLFYLLLSIVFVHDNHIWGKHGLHNFGANKSWSLILSHAEISEFAHLMKVFTEREILLKVKSFCMILSIYVRGFNIWIFIDLLN